MSQMIKDQRIMQMETLPISVHIGSDDYTLFKDVINQGIDSRLTGFTKSSFEQKGARLQLYFDISEIEILLRRLIGYSEYGCENSASWESDIIDAVYGKELI